MSEALFAHELRFANACVLVSSPSGPYIQARFAHCTVFPNRLAPLKTILGRLGAAHRAKRSMAGCNPHNSLSSHPCRA